MTGFIVSETSFAISHLLVESSSPGIDERYPFAAMDIASGASAFYGSVGFVLTGWIIYVFPAQAMYSPQGRFPRSDLYLNNFS